MTTASTQRFVLFRKDFWKAFVRQLLFFMMGIILFAGAVATVAYFWKIHTQPKSIDAYLPAATTLGYMDMTFGTDTVARAGILQDIQQGRFGFLPQEVFTGSGAEVLDAVLGERMGVAVLRERQTAIPVYFAEIGNKEAVLEYIGSLGTVIPSTVHPAILTIDKGGSFFFSFIGKYWVVAPSAEILLTLMQKDTPMLVQDQTYLLGRGHLASRALGKGYVHVPLLLGYVFEQEEIRPLVRDIYLLTKPMLGKLTQIVWNIQESKKAGWSVVAIVHAEKSFMEYFRQVTKIQVEQPFWQGKPVTVALDTAKLEDWKNSLGVYLRDANDPLVLVLRAYLQESARMFANGLFTEGFPVVHYGAVLAYVDPVTFQPTLGISAIFDPKDRGFLVGWLESIAPMLLDFFGDTTVSMTKRAETVHGFDVTVFARAGQEVYVALSPNRLLLGWGNGTILNQWLGDGIQSTIEYPVVRTSSYMVDIQQLQSMWGIDDVPTTATGSFLYSLDAIAGGLRTFEDGVRFEFDVRERYMMHN